MTGRNGEWDGIIKARKAFFAAERALVKASADYEQARAAVRRGTGAAGGRSSRPWRPPGRVVR